MFGLTPSLKEFKAFAKHYNLIPVYGEFLADLETPVSAYLKLGDAPFSYLLESVEGGERMARYSIIGVTPSLIFKSKGNKITLRSLKGRETAFETKKDPLYELESRIRNKRQAPVRDLPPFSGGAVGYLGYDTVRFIEKIPDSNPDKMKVPDSFFILTDTLLVFDHLKKKIKIIANVELEDPRRAQAAYRAAERKILSVIRRLRRSTRTGSPRTIRPDDRPLAIRSNFSKSGFAEIVRKAKEYIKCGDIIQVVLSQAFRTGLTVGAFDVYRALRSINPSPYMFYLNCKEFKLVGSSPEVHVRCEDGRAMLRPIAGTRPRGKDEAEDASLEQELLRDPKERAEHLMLVDLGRNDLGRVCDYRSVRVPEFMTIERYSHVMHIVSLVEGRLQKGKSVYDLLRATFPAGTMSGAPKVRAMEIIDELENQKRGFYSGVVGYFSFSGNLDSCIAIRTILIKHKTAFVQAGAGIVADSDPAREYLETQNKAKALFKAIEFSKSGGTR